MGHIGGLFIFVTMVLKKDSASVVDLFIPHRKGALAADPH